MHVSLLIGDLTEIKDKLSVIHITDGLYANVRQLTLRSSRLFVKILRIVQIYLPDELVGIFAHK